MLLLLERQRPTFYECRTINIYANMHNLVQKLVPFLVCYKITEEWAANPDSPGTDLCGPKNKTCIHTLRYAHCVVSIILYCI